MKIGDKKLGGWVVLALFVFGLAFAIATLIGRRNSKTEVSVFNPDKKTEKQAAAQAQVVSEAMSHYSKTGSDNLEAILNEMKNMKPIKPGETE